MYYILSPVSIEELETMTPKNCKECLDKYGNIDEEMFALSEPGAKLYNIDGPIMIRHERKQFRLEMDMLVELLDIVLTYKKDYYCYILGDKTFKEFYGTYNLKWFGNLDEYLKRYKDSDEKVPISAEEYIMTKAKLGAQCEKLFSQVTSKKNGIWELKIEGVE